MRFRFFFFWRRGVSLPFPPHSPVHLPPTASRTASPLPPHCLPTCLCVRTSLPSAVDAVRALVDAADAFDFPEAQIRLSDCGGQFSAAQPIEVLFSPRRLCLLSSPLLPSSFLFSALSLSLSFSLLSSLSFCIHSLLTVLFFHTILCSLSSVVCVCAYVCVYSYVCVRVFRRRCCT